MLSIFVEPKQPIFKIIQMCSLQSNITLQNITRLLTKLVTADVANNCRMLIYEQHSSRLHSLSVAVGFVCKHVYVCKLNWRWRFLVAGFAQRSVCRCCWTMASIQERIIEHHYVSSAGLFAHTRIQFVSVALALSVCAERSDLIIACDSRRTHTCRSAVCAETPQHPTDPLFSRINLPRCTFDRSHIKWVRNGPQMQTPHQQAAFHQFLIVLV